MNVEEMLNQQAHALVAADPGVKPFVYRNRIKAEPFFTSIRRVLEDPTYAPWFLHFKPGGAFPNGTYHSGPRCDHNYDPPLCSDLYHFPGGPAMPGDAQPGDTNPRCDPPHCDCGGIMPCATYLYDWRNAHL